MNSLFLRRREFLWSGLEILGLAALTVRSAGRVRIGPYEGGAAPAQEVSEETGMIVYSRRYLTLEMPMSLLNSWITPVETFFVRNNLLMPSVDPTRWRLTVSGEVEQPLRLTFAELARFQRASVTNTLECAGNGRAFYRPRVNGVPWTRGGVGNAVFSGVRLADVLGLARIKPSGKHVAFHGLDNPPPGAPDFIRSIPIKKAVDADTLLATHMNGAALTPEHGFPVRALVPGWIGSASIKWLSEIRILSHEYAGYFMNPGYRIATRGVVPGARISAAETVALTSLWVKSIISQPAEGSVFSMASKEKISIRGAAWAGESTITSVKISTDEGRSWQEASLGGDQARHAWRLWEYDWQPPAVGSYVLASRATDARGRTQPMEPKWNPAGYLWNVVDRVRIQVRP